jgi:hypothetical protein
MNPSLRCLKAKEDQEVVSTCSSNSLIESRIVAMSRPCSAIVCYQMLLSKYFKVQKECFFLHVISEFSEREQKRKLLKANIGLKREGMMKAVVFKKYYEIGRIANYFKISIKNRILKDQFKPFVFPFPILSTEKPLPIKNTKNVEKSASPGLLL